MSPERSVKGRSERTNCVGPLRLIPTPLLASNPYKSRASWTQLDADLSLRLQLDAANSR
jgi:hypothetical protein